MLSLKVKKIRHLINDWNSSRDAIFDVTVNNNNNIKYIAPAKFITIEEDTLSEAPRFLFKFNTSAVIPKSADKESMATIMPFLESYAKGYLALPLEKIKIETDASSNTTTLVFRAFGEVPFNRVGEYLYYAGYEAGSLFTLNLFLSLGHFNPQDGYAAYLKYNQSVKRQKVFLVVWGKLSRSQDGTYKFEYSPFFYLDTKDPYVAQFYKLLKVDTQNLSVASTMDVESSFFKNDENFQHKFKKYRNIVYWDLASQQIKVIQATRSLGPAVETLITAFASSLLRIRPDFMESVAQESTKLISRVYQSARKRRPFTVLYAIRPTGEFKKAILLRAVVNTRTRDVIVYETQLPFQNLSSSVPSLSSLTFRYRIFRAPSSCWNIKYLKQVYEKKMDFSDSALFIFTPEFLDSEEAFKDISLFPMDILQM